MTTWLPGPDRGHSQGRGMRNFLIWAVAVAIGVVAMALADWTGWLIFAVAWIAGYLVGVSE